ncbi:hypothetical protein AUC61_14700 [Pseudomonas sp. S25]|uniref:Uncharacterized protein n=2 Tax=Pseudomonas maioricensis TaxID=1766623 RepID=A0ABS9ZJM5_9PSED|nr:hypothetical protein [Pseudomonas sp. S25]
MEWSAILTAVATVLLVIVGGAQLIVLQAQRRQQRLDLAEVYRRRWAESAAQWAAVVFLGRDPDDFYQVASKEELEKFKAAVSASSAYEQDPWALHSVRTISSILSEVTLRILQGQLRIEDAYPIFGTELLRHSRPLRSLLDGRTDYGGYGRLGPDHQQRLHIDLRGYMQDWLIYHDGIRRRSLIIIDMLWAEAVRLEDLPPSDIKSAADAKKITGHLNKKRLKTEFYRLRGRSRFLRAWRLAKSLGHAEYRRIGRKIGVDEKRLQELDVEWTERILRDFK